MTTEISVLKKSRELILNAIDGLTLEQIHKIPSSFNNNIAWNVGHIVVTQQLLHYKLSNLSCLIPDNLIEKYKKGTKPNNETFTQVEFDEIKELLIGLPDTLEEDYNAQIFKEYDEYKTSTGFVLDSIESAIAFNNFHEGIHYGAILALKKVV
ncbi:DinB family protein [Tenacibaculum sp. UWU-22]|uniref:DinB family protein n=1 Tax=Tenacibaculum sp. UWU-22 TaxID=3234187 RepID=UPI0034DAC885